jgi:hypothetical protein
MTKRILLILISAIVFSQGQAQEVPEVQNTLITKITATWCTFCGSWGWDAFNDIYDDNKSKAIIISNHYSGDLRNNTAIAFADNLNTFGQPLFYVNNTNQLVTSSNRSAKADEIKQQVDSNYETSPVVNTGIMASLDGNNLTIQTKTKFFKAAEGEYYLGIYAIENGVVNFQQSRGANAVHKNVMRGAIGSEAFGQMIANGNISQGAEINLEFSGNFSAAWNADNTTLATIIWKKEGNVYKFVNGFVHDNWQTTTSLEDLKIEGLTVTLLSSITKDNSTLVLDVEKPLSNIQLILHNSLGKIIERRLFTNLSSGKYYEEWNFQNQPAGTYIIQIVSSDGRLSKRVIVQ